MALTESLKQLSKQSLDELFNDTKESILLERVSDSINRILPQIKERLAQELGNFAMEAARKEVSKIKVRDGRDGRDAKPGLDGQDGKDGSPDTPTEIRDKLASLEGESRLDASSIKNLEKALPRVVLSQKRGGGGSTVRTDDFSASVDGSARTFTATYAIGTPLLLVSTQFPTALRPTVDYTVAGKILTFASGTPTVASGQSLLFVYVEG